MAKNYLIHYGVPKSQWSAQARSKYDAEHRRKYGQEDPRSIQNGRGVAGSNSSGGFGSSQSKRITRATNTDAKRFYGRFSSSPNQQSQEPKKPGRFAKTAKIGYKSNQILVKPQISGSSSGKVMGSNAIDKRLRDSKVWNSLTQEQKKRAQDLADVGKNARKALKLPLIGGSFLTKQAVKRSEKKTDNVDRLLRNAQNVYDHDTQYRTNRSAKSANGGYGANIIQRKPGAKQISIDKNGKVYKFESLKPVATVNNRTDLNTQSDHSLNNKSDGYSSEATLNKKAKKELEKEYNKAMVDRLHNSSRKRNDSGKTTKVEKRGSGLGSSHSLREELGVRKAVLDYNRKAKGGQTAAEKVYSSTMSKILKNKIANAKTMKEYYRYQDIRDRRTPGTTQLIAENYPEPAQFTLSSKDSKKPKSNVKTKKRKK